jgi:CzcA family heavy metal efflux pump
MLNAIIKYSLANRLLVLCLAAMLMGGGLWLSQNIDVDVFPDLTAPSVTIMTETHGLTAEETEKLVTYKIETALNGAPNVARIRSSSMAELSTVWVEFDWGTEIYLARQVINERLGTLSSELPLGVPPPTMLPIASIMGEIQMVGISADSTSNMELRTLVDWNLRPTLQAIKGVAKVVTYGGDFKEYQILASPSKMKYHNISLMELKKAVEDLNKNASGGFVEQYGQQYLISLSARIKNIKEIEEALVKMQGDIPVRIGDVATVKIAAAQKVGEASLNGKNALIVTILKQPETNTLELTKRLDACFDNLEKTLPADVKINREVFKQANFIESSVDNLQKSLMEGVLFVIIILFIFLMEWRTTLISVMTIPISIFASLLVLHFMGLSINTMTLGGLAIAVGVLVDDAIIDVENVHKRLRQNAQLPEADRIDKMKIVYDATFEVRSSILNSSLIIIAAFMPLFFLSGIEGRLLQPLGIAFLVSIIASLVVALTVTPVLCTILLKSKYKPEAVAKTYQSFVTRYLLKGYERLLPSTMRYAYPVIGSSIGLFLISALMMWGMGRSFLPEFNEGSFTISAVATQGTSLEETNRIGLELEKVLLTVPEIKLVGRRTGRAPLDEHAQSIYASEIEVPLTKSKRTKEQILTEIREKTSNIQGVVINIGQPISHRIDHILSGTRSNIAVKIFGDDLTQLFKLGNEIKTQIETVEGAVDVNLDQQVEIPQIFIYPKPEMLARQGISTEALAHFIEVALGGEVLSQIYEGQRSFDLRLRMESSARNEIEKLKLLTIDNYKGEKIPLEEVASVVSGSTPERINREKVKRKLVVAANVADRDLKSVVTDIQKQINKNVKLPEGYFIEYGGQFESAERATQMLTIASVLALLIIFLLIYKEFGEWMLSLIVFANLPLALIGGAFIVYFGTNILSIASAIGFISLFGIATRNGMLLVSRYQALMEEGRDLKTAIIEGSLDRLNPILMTALTTVLALVPLVMAADEAGNEIQSPMALVILGGLISSTLLNLLVIPSTFYLLKSKNKTV